MKVLTVCQYYDPEPFRITDMCEELVQRGHEVTILTGVPNYPMGKIYPGYEKGQKRVEEKNGVKIIRCLTIPRKTDTLHRLLNYFSYPISAWFKVGKLDNDFDVVFTNQQSPVMMCWPAIRYAKKHHKKVVMYCMDLWPASLAAGGMRDGVVYKFFGWLSKGVYRKMDLILNTSRMFEDYLVKEFGIEKNRIQHLPQYAEEIFDHVGSVKDDYVDLMFAGNVGTAQSIDTIIKAAKLVKNSRVRWHIVGDGKELENLRKMAEGMDNVIFHGRKPLEEMPKYYAMADAMLVTLMRDSVISLTLPGKVQTYMAAGKPIICAGDGETKLTIEEAGCGFAVGGEDAQGLAEVVERFVASADKESMGGKARAYFDAHYRRENFFDGLESALKRNC